MPRPAPRNVEVFSTQQITPNMLRVTLTGEGLRGFPEGFESGYVKFRFPDAPGSTPDKVIMRTYSIRAFDSSKNLLSIDFALHDDSEGLASAWAKGAKPGDPVEIGGPGSVKPVSHDTDYVLLAADMTGLPALACNLERLPADAKGIALIEITSEADRQDITHPEGVEVHWLVNPGYAHTPRALSQHVRDMPWPEDGTVGAWCACEFHSMQDLRSYLRNERGIPKEQIYISSYWKIGRTEDGHQADKRLDRERENAAQASA